jgi:hypothetical protein
VRELHEPLTRLRRGVRQRPPVVGLERPPRDLLVALRAAADEAAAGAATLALLDAGPRSCDGLLSDLAERQKRARQAAREIRSASSPGADWNTYVALAAAFETLAHSMHDAGAWWCRSAGCEPELQGLAGALRDATRELARALAAFPDQAGADAAVGVHRRVSEGRRLGRRARAIAIKRADVREVLGRMAAIAAVERALAASGRAARAVQQLSAS